MTASGNGPSGVFEINGIKPTAAAAPLRHVATIDLGVAWQCTEPATSDAHGCFSELRPRSGDRIDRNIGDRAQEPAGPPTSAPVPPAPPPQIGGLQSPRR